MLKKVDHRDIGVGMLVMGMAGAKVGRTRYVRVRYRKWVTGFCGSHCGNFLRRGKGCISGDKIKKTFFLAGHS